MSKRQILGIRSGGFDGADSNFGENGENRLNTTGATLMPRPFSVFLIRIANADIQSFRIANPKELGRF